jgi:hypothetical protein
MAIEGVSARRKGTVRARFPTFESGSATRLVANGDEVMASPTIAHANRLLSWLSEIDALRRSMLAA